MQPPMESNPRRGMEPSMLSPFPTTATAAGSEHPCVTLIQWWLAKVEGDDERIAVAGVSARKETVEDFAPALIAKRHEVCVLETENGIILQIYGPLNIERMLSYGYSSEVCEKFRVGFPCWWQHYNLLYPKEETSSNARCPPSSSNTSNSKVDPRLFDLKMFQPREHVHLHGPPLFSKLISVNCSSHNDAAFQKSLHLPNGAPRFEEYTSNGQDEPTSVCLDVSNSYLPNENAAASNDDGERDEAVCNEVENSLLGCKNTPVASLKSQGCQKKHQCTPSNEKVVSDHDMLPSLLAGMASNPTPCSTGGVLRTPTVPPTEATPSPDHIPYSDSSAVQESRVLQSGETGGGF